MYHGTLIHTNKLHVKYRHYHSIIKDFSTGKDQGNWNVGEGEERGGGESYFQVGFGIFQIIIIFFACQILTFHINVREIEPGGLTRCVISKTSSVSAALDTLPR